MCRFLKLISAAILILLSMNAAAFADPILRGCYAGYGTVLNPVPLQSHPEDDDRSPGILTHAITISANLALFPIAYNQMEKTWGVPNGKFHFKDDWSGDNMALNDEVSHMVVSYKLTQLLNSGYRALGYSPKTALWLGMIEAAFIVTAVEYPIDAYNPDQGMGISDLFFDYGGIALGYLKITNERFANWDLKTSVKSFSHANRQVLGDAAEDYDNYIYWLTYRVEPAVFGLGYSTSHPGGGEVDKEFYFALGTTIPDLLSPISDKLSKWFRWSEFYYFNLKWNFLTID